MRKSQSIYGKLRAAIAMLLVSTILLGSSTYAWLLLSTAPEVSNVDVVMGANEALEIALATKEHMSALQENDMYDTAEWSGFHNDDVYINNTLWGNIVDLGDDCYGLQYITMKPAALNVLDNVIRNNPISTPMYGDDGRIVSMNTTSTFGTYNRTSGVFDTADDSDYGVRVIGRTADSALTDRILDKRRQVVAAYKGVYDAFGGLPAEVYLFELEESENYTLAKMRTISGALLDLETIFIDLVDLMNTSVGRSYDEEAEQVLEIIESAQTIIDDIEQEYQVEGKPGEGNTAVALESVKSLLDLFCVTPSFSYGFPESTKITDYQSQREAIYESGYINGSFGMSQLYMELYDFIGDALYASSTNSAVISDGIQSLRYGYTTDGYSGGWNHNYGWAGNAAVYADSYEFDQSYDAVNTYNAAYTSYISELNGLMQRDYFAVLRFAAVHAENLAAGNEDIYSADEWIGPYGGTGMYGRLLELERMLEELDDYYSQSITAIETSKMFELTDEQMYQLESAQAELNAALGEIESLLESVEEEVYGYITDTDGERHYRYLGNDPDYPTYSQKDYDTMVSLWSSYLDLNAITINGVPFMEFYENLDENLVADQVENPLQPNEKQVKYTISFGGDSAFEKALSIVNDPVMVACVNGSVGILQEVDEARENEYYKHYSIPETVEVEWTDFNIPGIPDEYSTALKLTYDPTYEVYPFFGWTYQLDNERETDREFVFRVVNHYAYRYESIAQNAYQNVSFSADLFEAVKNQIIYEITGEYQTKGYTTAQLSAMADSLTSSVSALNSYLKYFNELLKLKASGDGTTRAQYEAFMAAETIDEKLTILNIGEDDPLSITYYDVKNALADLEAAAVELKALEPQKAEIDDETGVPIENELTGLVKAEDVASALELLVPSAGVLVNGQSIDSFNANAGSIGSITITASKGPFAVVNGVCGGGSSFSAALSASTLAENAANIPTTLRITGNSSRYSPGMEAWDGFASAPTDSESTDANRTTNYLLNEPYCFCVDMLFRTSESGGVLQLQTDPKYRVAVDEIYDDEDLNPELLGNGSFIESDNPEIYSSLRFVFADTLTREIYATALADEDGKLTLDNEQEYIIPLQKDRVEAITVWIYLDGDHVNGANTPTTGLSSLKVNLQFSTDTRLVPAWELLD